MSSLKCMAIACCVESEWHICRGSDKMIYVPSEATGSCSSGSPNPGGSLASGPPSLEVLHHLC